MLFILSAARYFCILINMKDSTTCHTVIIGAGAAGLMCAGSFNADKIVIEHNARPGAKLAVSGGGKCNFTNQTVTAAHYQSQSKHFCKTLWPPIKIPIFYTCWKVPLFPIPKCRTGSILPKMRKKLWRF